MDGIIKKTSGENSTVKKLVCIVTAIVVVLVVGISIGIYNSEANQLQRHLDLGRRYLDELDYEQAIVAFEQAIAIDPKCVDAYLGMAGAYEGMGNDPAAALTSEEGYANSLEIYDRLLELAAEDERVLNGLSDCIREYIEVLLREKRYDKIEDLAGKYGNLAVDVDFLLILEKIEKSEDVEAAANEERDAAEMTDAEQIQVSIKRTDIQADSVFNQEGYGCLTIKGVGSLWTHWEDPESVIPPQTALIDADGNFVFPYKSTYLTYRISDGVVSLTESSPYYTSDGYDWSEYPPAYYNLDGSNVFVPEYTQNEIEAEEQVYDYVSENIMWHGGPMQDGYALVIKEIHTWFQSGIVYGGSGEYHSYIMDKSGTITCTLPEEFNEELEWGDGGFDTKYSLGWCGEGLFAVFENSYDENWNYSSEAKGYMDPAGNMVLDLSGRGFTNLLPFHEGLAAVRTENGMIGFIDKTGALVIPCIYDDAITSFSEDGICAVKKDGKWGYIGRDGSEIIPFEYDNAYGAGDGLASVVKDGKCGLVDYGNHLIVPLEYDDISSGEGGTAYAIKDGVLYIISK